MVSCELSWGVKSELQVAAVGKEYSSPSVQERMQLVYFWSECIFECFFRFVQIAVYFWSVDGRVKHRALSLRKKKNSRVKILNLDQTSAWVAYLSLWLISPNHRNIFKSSLNWTCLRLQLSIHFYNYQTPDTSYVFLIYVFQIIFLKSYPHNKTKQPYDPLDAANRIH